jgi:hypothetical protein
VIGPNTDLIQIELKPSNYLPIFREYVDDEVSFTELVLS